MRYLAVDLGDKRTGLAAGDDVTRMAGPIGVLQIARGPALVEAVAAAVVEHAADAIVLGLPVNMDGTEGDRARIVRAFGAELVAAAGVTVHYQDERLTSFAADQRLARTGRTHKEKKMRRDALAAAEILGDFFAG
ncbi:MAG: Holliday junction resolvase RuvX [Phycisphaerales bacterium]|nr:Holliday junction resolvase RuvX [Phycisphaerae bacterium]NNF41923.1 Holliday junction resolvase RuvX [Phycisphaerales bacterium]NNM26589.1 Holliday junction resolvase RuvX [Phycisphaerales bacterium]